MLASSSSSSSSLAVFQRRAEIKASTAAVMHGHANLTVARPSIRDFTLCDFVIAKSSNQGTNCLPNRPADAP